MRIYQKKLLAKKKNLDKQNGFGLLETIVALGLFLVFVVTGVSTILHSYSVNRLADETSKATIYSVEGIEAVRSIKEEDFANLAVGTYGLDSSGGSWTFFGISDSYDKYTRVITISQAERDPSGKIVDSGGTVDPDTFKISSAVNWDFTSVRANHVETITYISNWEKSIITVGDWSNPAQESSLDFTANDNGYKIQVSGDYAYLVRESGSPDFYVINISDPSTPTVEASIDLSGNLRNIAIDGNYAYVASTDNSNEFIIIDISNPASPTQVATMNANRNSEGLGVDVEGNYAYLVKSGSSGEELFIYDISNPTSPSEVARIDLGDTGNEIKVMDGYAYIASANDSQELQVVNVSTPSSPSLVASFDIPSPHDGLTVDGFDNYILFGATDGAVHIIDVSIPSSPTEVGQYLGSDNINDISLSSDHQYAFLGTDDNAAEFIVLDISSLTSPTQVSSLDLSGDINGVAYHSDKDKVFAAGEDNSNEFLVFMSQ